MRFRVIGNLTPSNPYENLAVEEVLNSVPIATPVIRFWVNKPSVILGRFDKVEEEVNIEYCIDNDIIIARRHTGGGTVYHDEGNLNISLTTPRDAHVELSTCYKILTTLLRLSLHSLGLTSIYVDSNALLTNNKKISGMAGSLTKYSLHCHSTLLVNSDLLRLKHSLKKLKNEVTNVSDELKRELKVSDVYRVIVDVLHAYFKAELILDSLKTYEASMAKDLYLSKYCRDEWVFKA